MTPSDIDALPDFIRAHSSELPDPDAALAVLKMYEDTLVDFRGHPDAGNPFTTQTPTFDGPPTLERISGRVDGLFYALKAMASSLSSSPDWNSEWDL
ncbi:hypothetical protein UQW22_09945 [Isoptericola halotolerans]|uniref:hypothetical protein n=1 Tax=Isoptericola halotolerans TaxID=300560 RepID=UPI00388E67CF